MRPLDRHLPDFDVHEVHGIPLDMSPEAAVERVLALQVTPDRIVRVLFRLRGLRDADLTLEQFATQVLGLEFVERSATAAVATRSDEICRPMVQMSGFSTPSIASARTLPGNMFA